MSKFDQHVEPHLSSDQASRFRSKLDDEVIPGFLEAELPQTAIHGDANMGNFIVDPATGRVSVIDVSDMRWSFDAEGQPMRTGAMDVARYLESVESLRPGALEPTEIASIRQAFLDEYLSHSHIPREHFDAATRLFRIDTELASIRFASDAAAREAAIRRLAALLGEAP